MAPRNDFRSTIRFGCESNEYDDVQKIHELKTGKLIQVAISMPHLGNEKQDNLRMILHDIGKDLGLAFQIIDDVLEASSDSTTLGKSNQSIYQIKKPMLVSLENESVSKPCPIE